MNDHSASPDRRRSLLLDSFGTDTALLLLRAWLGAMFISHGVGKVFGDMTKFAAGVEKLGFPAPEAFAWAAALTEFAGGIAIIAGLGTRINAALGAVTMFVAGFLRHADDPFGKKELALTYLVLCFVLFITGPGRYSIDAFIGGRRKGGSLP